MTLDLCRLPKPSRVASKVAVSAKLDSTTATTTSDGLSTSILISKAPGNDQPPLVNLFQVKRVYGYFPFTRIVDGAVELAVRKLN